jgi:uncharacterized protein YbgA (DUF1722 family)/uncharacterized protein YbbK (DUF523 family)
MEYSNEHIKDVECCDPNAGGVVRIGVSACLLGQKVRYDGNHKLDPFIRDTLGRFVEFVLVCPEVETGLGVPREPMHLAGDPADPRLVTVHTGIDRTARMKAWGERRLDDLAALDLCGYIFKSRSPSSGMERIKVHDTDGRVISTAGVGIWARMVMERFPTMPVEDEGRLNDPDLRERFVERVFVYRRWRDIVERERTADALVRFHTIHKLLIMSHSPEHARELGRIAASSGGCDIGPINDRYLAVLTAALARAATVRKHANVLMHVMGYFKRVLTPEDKRELLETIERFHNGWVPLIVPITLLNHYVRAFDQPYLKSQVYLNPHPVELGLRNHV